MKKYAWKIHQKIWKSKYYKIDPFFVRTRIPRRVLNSTDFNTVFINKLTESLGMFLCILRLIITNLRGEKGVNVFLYAFITDLEPLVS